LVNDPAQLAKLANARSPKRFKAEMKLALFDFEPIEEDGVHYLLNEGLAAMHAEKLAGWEQKRQAGIDRARQRELERSKKKGEQIPNEAMKEAA
jgi:flagellar biosynthesis/type III secretory pathway protein FliH